jgi:tellurite resistance-related uncharacterized protein
MKDIPTEVQSLRRSPEFTNETVPKGLLKSHTTKEGTWAKIVVLEGSLIYRILEPPLEEIVLTEELYGVVEPTIQHRIEPIGQVKFYVEFYR